MRNPNQLLEAAVWYGEHGMPVFPCHNIREDLSCPCLAAGCRDAGKHPSTLHGKDDASTDVGHVRRWPSTFVEADACNGRGQIPPLRSG